MNRSTSRERVLAVERILSNRPKTTPMILDQLEREYGIRADRKSIYQDIAALTVYLPIVYTKQGFYIEKG